jgi:pimeloyl-ACP methyl ester carboxylesterase
VLSARARAELGPPIPKQIAAEINVAVNQVAPLLHRQLADESSRGVYRGIDGAGHYLHDDRPDVVIDAIRSMLASEATSP